MCPLNMHEKCSSQNLHIPFIIFLSLCQTYIYSGPICLTCSLTAFAINLVRVAGCPSHVN